MEQTSTVGWKAPVPLAGVVIALRSADKRGPSGPRLSWGNGSMLTDGKHSGRVRGMEREERDKLYDWLENGKVDVWLRRLMRERLDELEQFVIRHADEEDEAYELMLYRRPPRQDPLRWLKALEELRSA